MTVATNRPDGWPLATTVGYVSDGLTLYFLSGPQSQKARNLAGDERIPLTIDHDPSDPMTITGPSMAAVRKRYPEYAEFPMPKREELRFFRVTPVVISVRDDTKGFGHTDLVVV